MGRKGSHIDSLVGEKVLLSRALQEERGVLGVGESDSASGTF